MTKGLCDPVHMVPETVYLFIRLRYKTIIIWLFIIVERRGGVGLLYAAIKCHWSSVLYFDWQAVSPKISTARADCPSFSQRTYLYTISLEWFVVV